MSAGSTGQLSDRDLHALVSALGRGEYPKVAVHTEHGEIPAGAKGVLVDYDPEADLPCTVRLARNGSEQDVRVPTAVLAAVPRGRADVIARTAASAPPESTADADPGAAAGSTAEPGAAGTAGGARADDDRGAAPATGSDDRGGTDGGADPRGRAEGGGTDAQGGVDGGESDRGRGDADGERANGSGSGRRGRPAKAAAKKAARGGAGDVVITVTVAGDGATVEASHGSRKLVKPTALPVTAGHAVAQALDIESITGAVEAVIDEHRSAKQAEAEALRARLAELERELASYPGADDTNAEPEHAAAS